MFVCCECCVLSGRGLCDELITRPEESYRLWHVVVCDLEKPKEWGGHDPRWVAAPQPKREREKKKERKKRKKFWIRKQVVCKVTIALNGDKAARMNFLIPILEDLTSFTTSVTVNQSKRCNIAEDLNLNPLNPELNPICYLLSLLAHHFLHVSRIRVKSLTLRLLMSYIYGAPILDVSRSHTTTHHSR